MLPRRCHWRCPGISPDPDSRLIQLGLRAALRQLIVDDIGCVCGLGPLTHLNRDHDISMLNRSVCVPWWLLRLRAAGVQNCSLPAIFFRFLPGQALVIVAVEVELAGGCGGETRRRPTTAPASL